ncbi:hypothetical protein AGLY_012850 [Aphis glycines]|uniref:Uncharacterized protein n=1 Tax=Aphis glycines TaxID=307491 RepID=A0A6G0T7U8_APHGL|nr:hypothetical protein AGLY_012850 [Aphis glycines]
MLRALIVDNKSTEGSIEIYFVLWQKNISHQRILSYSSYRALSFNRIIIKSQMGKKQKITEDLSIIKIWMVLKDKYVSIHEAVENLENFYSKDFFSIVNPVTVARKRSTRFKTEEYNSTNTCFLHKPQALSDTYKINYILFTTNLCGSVGNLYPIHSGWFNFIRVSVPFYDDDIMDYGYFIKTF